MANINLSDINDKDRSLNKLNATSEHQHLKDNSDKLKPLIAVQFGELRLVPYFLGGHQGYYSDLAPVPGYDPIEFILEILSLTVLVLTWVFYQIDYNDFPDIIPIVFSSRGDIVKTGQKLILYIFPGLDTFIFVILTILQFITNRFRYTIQVTPENSKDVFKLTRKLILLNKLLTMLLFVFLTFGTIGIIKDTVNGYAMCYSVVSVLFYGMTYYWFSLQLQKIADKTI